MLSVHHTEQEQSVATKTEEKSKEEKVAEAASKVEEVVESKPTNGKLAIPKRGKTVDAPPHIGKGRNNDFADAWEVELNQAVKDGLTGQWAEYPGSPASWAAKLRKNFVIDYVTDDKPNDVQPGAVTRDVQPSVNLCTLYVLIPAKVERL